MKKLKQSRGTQIDMELLTEKYGNRFAMIQFASKRAYELRRGAEATITDNLDPFNSGVVTALLELQAAK